MTVITSGCRSATDPSGTVAPASPVARLFFASNPLANAGVPKPGDPTPNWDIFSSDIDGSDVRQLTNDPADDLWPTVSPDRTQIAFFSSRSPFGIYAMALDGSQQRLVFAMPVTLWNASHLTWSPDGLRLAFSTPAGIWIVHADGSGAQLYRVGVNPSWSPDGHSIVYNNVDTDAIYQMGSDGTNSRALIASGRTPSYSPDGRLIAFSRVLGSGLAIYVANADGTHAVALTAPPQSGVDDAPSWSRDGQQLAFVRDAAVWVVNASGLNARPVPTRAAAISADPSW